MDQNSEPATKRSRAESAPPAAAAAEAVAVADEAIRGVTLEHASHAAVFLDVAVAKDTAAAPKDFADAARVKIELFSTITPKTAENFRQLCTGEATRGGAPAGYKGCGVHRVVPGFLVQAGDFVKGDGSGVFSVYNGGGAFDNENHDRKHDAAGLVTAPAAAPGRSGCQFAITLAPLPQLDGKQVVFGRVVAGMDAVRRVAALATDGRQRPTRVVRITESGEL